jgi:hypothetical protein
VAVVAINHLNKAGGGKAIYRSMGSLAFMAAARAGWLIAKSPEDPERRLMLVAKMNVSKEAPGLSFRIDDGRVCWDAEPVHITADQALNASSDEGEALARSPRLSEASEFNARTLAERGGKARVAELRRAADAHGIKERTFERACVLLGLVKRRVGFGPQSHFVVTRTDAETTADTNAHQPMLLDTGGPAIVPPPAHAPR